MEESQREPTGQAMTGRGEGRCGWPPIKRPLSCFESTPLGNSLTEPYTRVGAKRGWRSVRAMVKRRDHRSHTVNRGSRLLRRQSNELPGPQVLTLAWGSKRIGDRTPATSTNIPDAAPDYQPYNSKLTSRKDARKHWNQVRMRVTQGLETLYLLENESLAQSQGKYYTGH